MPLSRTPCFAYAALFASLIGGVGSASTNVILNPGFEAGTDADASDWLQASGPSGSSSRSDSMPNSGSYSAYMQADHFLNPAAPTPYTIEQLQPVGSIDNSLNYNLSFSAKVDSTDFNGFDMFYQVLWLDQDASDGGGVKGEFLNSLIAEGIGTDYQTFGVSDIDVPDGVDSFQIRFQLSPGAVGEIANGLYIDDVFLGTDAEGLPGDFNADGSVDAADYTVWRDNLNSGFGLNGNGDESGGSAGVVDGADYALWQSQYGGSGAPSSQFGVAVPEPNSLGLLFFVLTAAAAWNPSKS
ncbi:hypothetical protein MalM25_30200 [Planctomycetes bacterium MalM25]|nr:hypothetical protein MalM25_30200 [Planctomycetes bacterium MalM25]